MNTYAVVLIGNNQHKVELGQLIEVDKLNTDKKELVFDQVLLVAKQDDIKIGQPTLDKTTVVAKVVDPTKKGKKLRVFRYKAKSRYRKTTGTRPVYTVLEIVEIAGDKLKSQKAAPKKKSTTKKSPSSSTKAGSTSSAKKAPAKKSASTGKNSTKK